MFKQNQSHPDNQKRSCKTDTTYNSFRIYSICEQFKSFSLRKSFFVTFMKVNYIVKMRNMDQDIRYPFDLENTTKNGKEIFRYKIMKKKAFLWN